MGPAARTLVGLAWGSVKRRPLSSALTALAVALGVGLVLAVDVIRTSTDRSFTKVAGGYDVIVGPAHGSRLQVVLSTLFHVDVPGGTLPWRAYEALRDDPMVAAAVPYAMGDTYRGYRVVGTDETLFTTLRGRGGSPVGGGLMGRLFVAGRFEAVVGSVAARATGLSLGSTFRVTHGLEAGGHVHDERWRVVGVLHGTATPIDRAIYIPLQTFHAIPGHGPGPDDPHGEPEDGEHAHEDHDEHAGAPLSAVGVQLKSPGLRLALLHEFRQGKREGQAVLPADEIRRLLAVVGDVDRVISILAWLVTAVAALGILVGLYNTIHGRRREIAVLRALGARPLHVFGVILLEALLLCVLGGLVGLLLGHLGVAAAGPTLQDAYGVEVDVAPGLRDLQILVALVVLGTLAGLLPAWRGLSTPVAQNLESDA